MHQQNMYVPSTCMAGAPGCNAAALAIPLGCIARQGEATLLPRHLGVRSYVCGNSLVLWMLHGFEVGQAAPLTVQYAVPRTAVRSPPRYQPALLYPPRSLVQHGVTTYQNMTSDDLNTPPPRGWTPVPAPRTAPVLQCTAALALCLRDGAVHVCSVPAVPGATPVQAAGAPECLLPAVESDEIYLLRTGALAGGDTVMALWQLKVPLPAHAAVLVPSLAHPCRVSVRFPSAPAPALDLAALVQPVERIQHGARALWWYPELARYCNAAGHGVELAQVAAQLGPAAYHGTRVVLPDGIWTEEAGARMRTEVHLGLPAARALPRIGLHLPIPLMLQQLPVPPRPAAGRYLLLAHGHVLATASVPVTHDQKNGPDWYSYAKHVERLAWDTPDPLGVLWVVHRPGDPEPRLLWVSEDSWATEEDWACEEYAYTACPAEHKLVAAVEQAQAHCHDMLCRMWEEGQQESNALLLLLCTLDDAVPWQAQSAELLQQWPHMTAVTTNLPLLQQVLQLLTRMGTHAAVETSEVARTWAQAPHALPSQPLGKWSGGRLATAGAQGTASLAAQRRSPWTRHLGADYNRLQRLLVLSKAPPPGSDAEVYRHLHGSFSIREG